MAREKRVCCLCHCSCGRHFASLEAFDLHRVGSNGNRHCEDPNDVEGETPRTRLAPKDTDGICDLSEEREIHGVTVWQTEAARDSGGRPS